MSMTIDQALETLRKLVHEYGRGPDMGAIRILRAHIEREVDEAMVERAINAYVMAEPYDCDVEVVPSRIKAALTAALGPEYDALPDPGRDGDG